VNRELVDYIRLMEEVHLSRALQKVLAISALGNKYMQDSAPWDLVRQGGAGNLKRAATVIGVCANLAMLFSPLLYPFMPSVSRKIREQCNISRPLSLPQHFIQFLKPGHQISEPSALFSRLEQSKITEWKKQFGASEENQPEKGKKKGKKEKGAKPTGGGTC